MVLWNRKTRLKILPRPLMMPARSLTWQVSQRLPSGLGTRRAKKYIAPQAIFLTWESLRSILFAVEKCWDIRVTHFQKGERAMGDKGKKDKG